MDLRPEEMVSYPVSIIACLMAAYTDIYILQYISTISETQIGLKTSPGAILSMLRRG